MFPSDKLINKTDHPSSIQCPSFQSTSVRFFQYSEADEQSTMGTNVANVEMNWNVTKHFLMSFGSIPGNVDMSNGMT